MLAMQYNAGNGATLYDFLAGDSDHNDVLARPHAALLSVRAQHQRPKFLVEDALVAIHSTARHGTREHTLSAAGKG
jgi:hypothetical protein